MLLQETTGQKNWSWILGLAWLKITVSSLTNVNVAQIEDTKAKYLRDQYFIDIRFLLSLKWHKGINLTEPAEYCSMISQEERAEAVCRKKQV